jgi:DnaJ-domain-containing protein 1
VRDCFALLDEPRRPWLDPDSLKRKFLSLSAQSHPDRVHSASDEEKRAAQQRYAELNAAYNCLREPKDRLAHLVELEQGAKPKEIQDIPSALMDRFLEVSQLCRQTDGFLAEKGRVTSPLLKVEMFQRAQEWSEKLSASQRQMNSWHESLLAELKELDARWIAGKSAAAAGESALKAIEELYRLLSYFTRWRGQIQERIVQLAF